MLEKKIYEEVGLNVGSSAKNFDVIAKNLFIKLRAFAYIGSKREKTTLLGTSLTL